MSRWPTASNGNTSFQASISDAERIGGRAQYMDKVLALKSKYNKEDYPFLENDVPVPFAYGFIRM